MKNYKVENMTSSRGNTVANQFVIYAKDESVFQSYSSIIAIINHKTGKTTLDKNKWDYSQTTGKYRNEFLREDKKTTEAKIKSGEYKLADLNN